MKQVMVERFGGPEVLRLVEADDPKPGPGEVLVRLSSIGMNHADLMARRGEYKLSSGEPPFTPGIEGGGIVQELGEGVTARTVGQRVLLSPDAPRRSAGGLGGTYRTHYVLAAEKTVPAPGALPDDQLGAVWLAYLTAWGCLIWKHELKPGQVVAIPAASSSVGLATAQIVKQAGAISIGLTTSADKMDAIRAMPENDFPHLICTRDDKGQPLRWHRDLMSLTGGRGVDVFFDPVAAGDYLNTEIRCLAQHGTIWVYGLLGDPGVVDVSPLIRKHGAIRGWVMTEIAENSAAADRGCRDILSGFEKGVYRQHVAERFALEDVRRAHEVMDQGKHFGKLVLVP